LLSLAMVACVPQSELALDMPADVAFIAAVLVAPDGRVVESSDVQPRSRALFLEPRDGHELVVVGWPESLAAVIDDARVEGVGVVAAPPCAPRLPTPSWSEPEGMAPALSAKWLIDRAEALDPSSIVMRSGCDVGFCDAVTVPVGAAAVGISADCGGGEMSVEVRVDGDGALCGVPETLTGDCRFDGGSMDEVSLVCAGEVAPCAMDVVRVRPRTLFEVERFPILELPADALRAPTFVNDIPLSPRGASHGYLADFAVLGDRVVVATREDQAWRSHQCRNPVPTELRFLDEELQLVRTATAPPCVWRMELDGLGGLFLAYTRPDGHYLGRVDGHGRLLGEVFLRQGDLRSHIVGIVHQPGEPVAVVAISNDVVGAGYDGALFRVDTAAYTLTTSVAIAAMRSFDIGGAPTSFSFPEMDSHTVRVHDWTLAPQRTIGPLGINHLTRLRQSRYDAGVDAWVITSMVHNSELIVVDFQGGEPQKATFHERRANPIVTIPWDGDVAFVAMWRLDQTDRHHYSVGALFDQRDAKYLPGSQDLGIGVIARLRPAPGGGVLALNPWNAELFRVRPCDGC